VNLDLVSVTARFVNRHFFLRAKMVRAKAEILEAIEDLEARTKVGCSAKKEAFIERNDNFFEEYKTRWREHTSTLLKLARIFLSNKSTQKNKSNEIL
jgi:hypothetical protein